MGPKYLQKVIDPTILMMVSPISVLGPLVIRCHQHDGNLATIIQSADRLMNLMAISTSG